MLGEEVMTDKRKRPQKLSGFTYQVETGCGSMYVTINEDGGAPFEVFATMGKAGGCAASQIETIGRLISLGLRSGVQIEQIVKQMQGISCHSVSGTGEHRVLSCADAVAKTIFSYLKDKEEKKDDMHIS